MNTTRLVVASGVLAVLTACTASAGAGPATTAESPVPEDALDVRAVMQQQVNPAMLSIWDITNNVMNDEGGIDPAQMDTTKWRQVADGAAELAASGKAMSDAEALLAASPGNSEVGEGEVSMANVQQHLDSDPALFRQMGAAFATHSEKLAEAARTQDAAAAGELVAEMDGVCESCHARFWYPE